MPVCTCTLRQPIRFLTPASSETVTSPAGSDFIASCEWERAGPSRAGKGRRAHLQEVSHTHTYTPALAANNRSARTVRSVPGGEAAWSGLLARELTTELRPPTVLPLWRSSAGPGRSWLFLDGPGLSWTVLASPRRSLLPRLV